MYMVTNHHSLFFLKIIIIILIDCDALLVPNDNECGQKVVAPQPVILKRLFSLLSPLTLLRADCYKCPPCVLEQGK